MVSGGFDFSINPFVIGRQIRNLIMTPEPEVSVLPESKLCDSEHVVATAAETVQESGSALSKLRQSVNSFEARHPYAFFVLTGAMSVSAPSTIRLLSESKNAAVHVFSNVNNYASAGIRNMVSGIKNMLPVVDGSARVDVHFSASVGTPKKKPDSD
jgi:hypothetical protein